MIILTAGAIETYQSTREKHGWEAAADAAADRNPA